MCNPSVVHVNHVNHINHVNRINHVNHINHVSHVNHFNHVNNVNDVNHVNHVHTDMQHESVFFFSNPPVFFSCQHPKVQTAKSKHVFYLCTEDQKTMHQWVIAMKMAKVSFFTVFFRCSNFLCSLFVPCACLSHCGVVSFPDPDAFVDLSCVCLSCSLSSFLLCWGFV